ncbi:MAG: protein of unknown function DUF5040 [Bacteriophage sp.]|nr:MAG: protein of unknown function DUF5040 [Bacteriophage sp.]
MGNYEELKTAVAGVIKQNGNEEITGQIMQNTLLSMISNIGANSTFAGVATPETAPGTPDQNVFYLAGTPGVYANFGGYKLKQGIVMFTNASGAFTAVDLGFSNDDLKRLFLVDKSIIGIPNIDYDHLYNIPAGGVPGSYIDNNTYDTGWAIVPIDSGYMSVSGANITRVLFFSDINPVAANLINTFATNLQLIPIPATAKLALITLKKANNPEGYKNLRVSQPGAAATRSDVSLLKQRLYKNRSFSGKVDIDANMLVNIISGKVNYIPDTAFDVAFVDIFDKSKYLEITGATIVRVSFFSDYEINTANYISNTTNYITTIPSNAVMATITLRKTDNTDGYNNLRVNQNGAAPSSLRLLQNTGELFTEKSLFFNRSGNPITTTAYLTTTGFLPITGKDDIVVKGANNASVPAITFWDAHYKFIAPIAQTKQATNRVYTVAAADIPAGAKYIRCTRNENEDGDTTDSYIVGVNIAALLSMRENIIPEFKQVITGKNLINPDNLLRGITYASSTGLITSAYGILSNKLRLSPGTYTIKGVAPYANVQTTVRILRFNDKNEMVYADAITLDANKEGHYTVTAGTSGVGGNGYIDYWRIVLQFDTNVLFDPTVAQFEKNSVATDFEPCQTKLIENPAYNLTPRMAFMTGASSSMPGNGYFETACELLGFKHRNEAISGDSVMLHATRAWRGLIYEADGRMTNNHDNAGNFVGLYTFEELENIDIFVTSHIHNYDVAFEGKVFEKVETTFGYYSVTGVFYPSGAWALDKYNLSPNDTKLIVNTFTSESTTPHALFFDRNNNFISGDIIFDPAVSNTPIIDREIDVPENAAYVLIKRMYFPGSITKVRGVGYGILQKTVAEYEAKGYDASNNPLTVPMDKTDLTQRIVPYGGLGAPGAQVPNNLYDERYAAGYDYLLKKYALDCYNLRLNPDSKYYGTKSGKPVIIVCTTQWHDGYVRFNDSVKIMAKRHGAIVCDVANNVGFSYLQTDPTNDDSIRWGALHCNNAAIGSGNDTETIPIHGVMYTGMGWHPTRQWDCYIQMKRAQILAETMRLATYNNGDFGQII